MHLQTPPIGRFCAVGLGTMRGPDWTGTRTVLNAARAPSLESDAAIVRAAVTCERVPGTHYRLGERHEIQSGT